VCWLCKTHACGWSRAGAVSSCRRMHPFRSHPSPHRGNRALSSGFPGEGQGLVASVSTVAYLGLEARAVEVQCNLVAGLPKFVVVETQDPYCADESAC